MNGKQGSGRWGVVGALFAVALSGAAACGNGFAAKADCRESRTCPEQAAGGDATAAAGAPQGGGSSAAGEAPMLLGDGGSGGAVDVECRQAADCSNRDPSDGEETCVDGMCGPGNVPPRVVSVTPEDEAVDVEPGGSIVIELSEPLDEATVTADNVQILDGDEPVTGELSYANNHITFVPARPLGLLASYEVAVSTAVTDVEGAGLLDAFSSHFKVRDGAWSVKPVVAGSFRELAPMLPPDADGNALLAWNGDASSSCPATALWSNRGNLGSAKVFTYLTKQFCDVARTAVSPNGTGVISWFENAGSATSEYRGGKWAPPTLRSARSDFYATGGVAAADDGTTHFFGTGEDVEVWSSSPQGAWPQQGHQLTAVMAGSNPHIAVADNGDVVATWVAFDGAEVEVFVATYSSDSSSWSDAVALPGSSTGGSASAVRGMLGVVFDAERQPAVIWQRDDSIVVSRFVALQHAWSGPVSIDGGLSGFPRVNSDAEGPPLVFDGQSLVAAFTGKSANQYNTYVTRYDVDNDAWTVPAPINDAATAGTSRMPRMTADAHGNLLVVWAMPSKTAGVFNLAYNRLDAASDAWLGPKTITGAAMKAADLPDGAGRYVMGGNSGGLAALAFTDVGSDLLNLRLASFY